MEKKERGPGRHSKQNDKERAAVVEVMENTVFLSKEQRHQRAASDHAAFMRDWRRPRYSKRK